MDFSVVPQNTVDCFDGFRMKNSHKRPELPGFSQADGIRIDLRLIATLIEPGARVLDVGCGDGSLLRYLVEKKDVDGRGLKISPAGVRECLRQGLSVVQGDADTDLKNYPTGAFDYIVLSETLQTTHNPIVVLRELVRIGHFAIVSFPNFGYWHCRWQLLVRGRMPVTKNLPLPWYATPNIHFSTISDFVETCKEEQIKIVRRYAVNQRGTLGRFFGARVFANLFGAQGVFLLAPASAQRDDEPEGV